MNKRKPQQRTSFIGDELHAFDLTWRNYLPTITCCSSYNRIQLPEEEETRYDPTLYQTYSPMDIPTSKTKHKKDKTKKKKKKKLAVMETDFEEDIVYDAEFIADEQIANLINKDQKEYYIAQTRPEFNFYEQEIIEGSSSRVIEEPLVTVEEAQNLLSTELEGLTEQLSSIRNNITQIEPLKNKNLDIIISDNESITSEALHIYETSTNENRKKYSDYKVINQESIDKSPLGYFTDEQELEIGDELNIKNVFDIGKKWLGVSK